MDTQPLPSEPSVSFNQQSAGLWNRRLILNLLNEEGPLSRRQIGWRTGILNSTVAYIVRDLLSMGLLKVKGKGPSSGVGRRNILLGVNRDYGWGAGVSLMNMNRIRVEMLNTGLQRLDAVDLKVDSDPEALPEELVSRFTEWMETRGAPPGKCLGLAVGLPGIVDVERKVVLHSMRYRYRNFPLGERLAENLDVPVVVDHNANLAAHAEQRYGQAVSLKNFVYLLMNRIGYSAGGPYFSYGASLYLGGEVYRGASFAAGELDRATIPKMNYTKAEAEELGRILADEAAPLTPLVAELAKSLSGYLAPVVDLLDPEAVILGSDAPLANRAFLSLLEDWVQCHAISLQGRRIRMLPSELGIGGVACGGALRIVENGLYGRELADPPKNGRSDGDTLAD